jgi:hypothetical protein
MHGEHPENIYRAVDIKVFTIFHHCNHIFPHAVFVRFLSHSISFPIMLSLAKSLHSAQGPYSRIAIFDPNHAFLRRARLPPNRSIISRAPYFPHLSHITTSPISRRHLHFTRSRPILQIRSIIVDRILASSQPVTRSCGLS